MLTIETLTVLESAVGQAALAMAAERTPTPTTLLSDLQAMRRHFTPDVAAAALELVTLRERGRAKFALADRMFFTRDALEQATSETVARHTAARFRGDVPVWDVCCSIGGDLLEIARTGASVTGVDLDLVRLRMAHLNAEVYGVAERVHFEQRDAATWHAPPGSLVFFDPARRSGGHRVFDPANYQPPLGVIAGWLEQADGIGVKVAPGIAYDDLPWGPCEVEIVSLGGDVKEAVLWYGRLQTAERRATLLPSGCDDQRRGNRSHRRRAATAVPVRAGRCDHPRTSGGASRSHARCDQDRRGDRLSHHASPVDTPFARRFRIDDVIPWNLKRLRQYLRDRNIGHTVIKKRGSPIDPQVLEKQLRLEGSGAATLVLTHVAGKPSVLVCDVTP